MRERMLGSSAENGSSISTILRIDRERARDGDPLTLAARQHRWIFAGVAGEPDEASAIRWRAPAARSLSPAPKRSSEPSSTLSSAVRHGTSRGDWNTKAISGQASCGARPSTVTRPRVDIEQAADDPQRGRFAAAGRAENANKFATPDVEAQPVINPLFAKHDADILKRDDRIDFHADPQGGPFS